MWKCPKCQHKDRLNVVVTATANLHQYGDDDYSTELDGDHEWGSTSHMSCGECLHSGTAKDFETEEEATDS